MKSIRIVGLCLVAMIAMSVVAAGTASAAAGWLTCKKEAAGTKYETEGCVKASATGKWAFEEVKGTEADRTFGTLRLADTKVPIVGKVVVNCTGEGVGSVGPGAFSRTEKINNIVCSAGENCEKIEGTGAAEPRNLPWQGELAEEAGAKRNRIEAGGAGVGWAVSCRVLGITKEDVCTIANSEKPFTVVSNVVTANVQLVLLTFPTTPKAKCSVGGAGAGEVTGSVGLLMPTRTIGLLARIP